MCRAFTVIGTGGEGVQYQVTLNGERWPRSITTEADGTWRVDVSAYDARQDTVVLGLAGDDVSETYWAHPSVTTRDRFTLTLRSGEQSGSFVFTAA